jgi:hypothetical protein
VKERFAALGFQPVANTPEEYATYIQGGNPEMGQGRQCREHPDRLNSIVT